METITDLVTLQARIDLTERKLEGNKAAISSEFKSLLESLKPVNLIKRMFHSVKESPDLKADLLKGAVGLGTGFLTNKLLAGKVAGPLRMLISTLLPAVVSKVADAVPEKVKDNGLSFIAKTLRSMKIQSSEDKVEEQHASSGAVL